MKPAPIKLGYVSSEGPSRPTPPIGFLSMLKEAGTANAEKALCYSGDQHLMTIAPTGAGKAISAALPTLCEYPGQVIVNDPKGELYLRTAEKRRALGHRVVLLDPFHIIPKARRDSFNLLDICYLRKEDVFAECQTLANNLSEGGSTDERYWDDNARNLISGLLGLLLHQSKAKRKRATVPDLLRTLFVDDLAFTIATLLDQDKHVPEHVRQSFSSYFAAPSDRTRPCIDNTAQGYLQVFKSPGILESLGKSTFDLQDIIDGKPITVYIVMPPDKMDSHRVLMVQWLHALFTAITTRKKLPKEPTLFLIDETATLGKFPMLSTFIAICRGFGVRVWTFWQELAQVHTFYPAQARTIIGNCGVIQLFGTRLYSSARDLHLLTGIPIHMILNCPNDRQNIILDGAEYLHIRKLNFLLDYPVEGDEIPPAA